MKIIEFAYRTYVEEAGFEATIKLYESLEGRPCERRVAIPETRITVAKIGHFLVMSGAREDLDKVRSVGAIFYVDDLEAFATELPSRGVEILHGPRDVTAGRNLTARHPDGLVVEYFEARS